MERAVGAGTHFPRRHAAWHSHIHNAPAASYDWDTDGWTVHLLCAVCGQLECAQLPDCQVSETWDGNKSESETEKGERVRGCVGASVTE